MNPPRGTSCSFPGGISGRARHREQPRSLPGASPPLEPVRAVRGTVRAGSHVYVRALAGRLVGCVFARGGRLAKEIRHLQRTDGGFGAPATWHCAELREQRCSCRELGSGRKDGHCCSCRIDGTGSWGLKDTGCAGGPAILLGVADLMAAGKSGCSSSQSTYGPSTAHGLMYVQLWIVEHRTVHLQLFSRKHVQSAA